jgi:hypothetical protein
MSILWNRFINFSANPYICFCDKVIDLQTLSQINSISTPNF